MAFKMRNGKGYEQTVFGLLTLEDFDVYAPVVDDQGIDAIIRVPQRRGQNKYFDVQIKGAQNWNGCRCKVGGLPANGVLIIYCNHERELLWFLSTECTMLFPPKNPQWGDIFLTKGMVDRFRAEGRGELQKLKRKLGGDYRFRQE